MTCHADLFLWEGLGVEVFIELLEFERVGLLGRVSEEDQKWLVIKPLIDLVKLFVPDFAPLNEHFRGRKLVDVL